MVHYNNPSKGPSNIKLLPLDSQEMDVGSRKIFISRCAEKQVTILTKAIFDSTSSRGMISMTYLPSGDKVHYGFSEQIEKNIVFSTQSQHNMKVDDQKSEKKKMKKKLKSQMKSSNGGTDECVKDVTIKKGVMIRSINEQNTPLKKDYETSFHEPSTDCPPTVEISPTMKNSDLENTEQVIVSPSMESSSCGAAVSPEQPVPTALKFQKESTKNDASIKKYFQQNKQIVETHKKRRSVETSSQGKNARSKIVKFTELPNKSVPRGSAVKVAADKGTQTSTSTESKCVHLNYYVIRVLPDLFSLKPFINITLVDVASALCNMHSVSTSDNILKKSYSVCHTSGDVLEDCNDVAFLHKGNNKSELLNEMKIPTSLCYRKSGTFSSVTQPWTNIDTGRRQFDERRKMIIHHRASHERLRNSLLSSVQDVIKNNDNIRESTSMVEKTISEYEDMLVSYIVRI